MSKGTYQAVELNDYLDTPLNQRFGGEELTVGIDVAKHTQYACLMGSNWNDYDIVTFEAAQADRFLRLVARYSEDVTVVLEPSGTYGDPLRKQCRSLQLDVGLIRPKQVHDAAELFDGVPSLHDAKAAYLICRLHQNQVTRPWRQVDTKRRRIRAILARLDEAELQRNRMTGKLEALVSRHWPELTEVLDLKTATLQRLLSEFGGPAGVAAEPDRARRLMRKVGGPLLAQAKIEAVLDSAGSTRGVEMLPEEERTTAEFATRLYEARTRKRREERRLEKLAEEDKEATHIGDVVGVTTACVLIGFLGSVTDYHAAAVYEKSGGLNLKEKSSGKHKGQLKITKRGPAVVRRYLWMAAMRMVSKENGCPVAAAWYEKMVARNGGNRSKALVALMRKLIRALYHIGHGQSYDPTKLFDVSRLDVKA